MTASRWLAAALLAAGAGAAAHRRADPPYHVERLGDGVWAVVRHDPVAFGNNANSLVVETDSGVLVVDAQFTRAATQQTLHAIRGLTPKAVRWVVNTHWHDDHVAGNQVYRDSFPNVDFVSQTNTQADLVALGAPNRKATWSGVAGYVGRLKRLMAMGLGGDSTPLVPAEKAALESSVGILEQYAADESGFRETLATVTFDRQLTLGDGRRRVELHWFGPANTRGDAVVVVPAQGIVATGDLLVSPGPFAFGSDIGGWVAALDSVRALRPRVLLPGHGPVMRDDTYLRLEQRMLAAVRDRTAAALAAGATSLADVRKAVTLDDLRAEVAGDDKWKRSVFHSFFLGPAVGQAYQAARPKP